MGSNLHSGLSTVFVEGFIVLLLSHFLFWLRQCIPLLINSEMIYFIIVLFYLLVLIVYPGTYFNVQHNLLILFNQIGYFVLTFFVSCINFVQNISKLDLCISCLPTFSVLKHATTETILCKIIQQK